MISAFFAGYFEGFRALSFVWLVLVAVRWAVDWFNL